MDLAIELTESGADLVLEGGDLRIDRGLRSAALLSLFCDSRARDDDVAPGDDRRGWWAEAPDDEWGSRLWLLARAKRTPDTLQLARDHAQSAFAWAQRQGVAERVDVGAAFGAAGALHLQIAPVRGSARRWQHLWAGEQAASAELDGVLVRILRS